MCGSKNEHHKDACLKYPFYLLISHASRLNKAYKYYSATFPNQNTYVLINVWLSEGQLTNTIKKKRHVFKGDWTTPSNVNNFSTLDNEHD